MTREEARKAAEVMLAYADGKEIEYKPTGIKGIQYWNTTNGNPAFNWCENSYRIKPESKYRPFKDAEECWQEMQKHQPFGWIKDKEDGHYTLITCVDCEVCLNAPTDWDMGDIMNYYTFADGSVFGVKEEGV